MSKEGQVSAWRDANSRIPISILSNDILTEVFSLNLAKKIDRDVTSRHQAMRTIRHTSQVCYRWRTVAIGYPALWCNIEICSRPEWIKELWRRSKNSLVTLTIKTSSNRRFRIDDMHIPRLRGLHASTPSNITGLWDKLLLHPNVLTTQMEILEFVNQDSGGNRNLSLTIPTTLDFRGQQPSLKTLKLTGCNTDLRSVLFSNLSVLCLHNIKGSLNVQAWLKILSGMPRLVKLTLHNTCSTIGLIQPQQTAHLPHLKSFRIRDKAEFVNALFMHLTLPLSCAFLIRLFHSHPSDGIHCNMDAIIAKFSQCVAHNIAKGHSHFFGINERNAGCLVRYRGDHTEKLDRCDLEFGSLYCGQQLLLLLTAMADALPFVTKLTIGLYVPRPEVIFHLRKFTGVTSLHLLKIHRLSNLLDSISSDNAALFPSLRTLTLCSFNLDEGVCNQILSLVQWRRSHHPITIESIHILEYEGDDDAFEIPHYKSFSVEEMRSLNELGVCVSIQVIHHK